MGARAKARAGAGARAGMGARARAVVVAKQATTRAPERPTSGRGRREPTSNAPRHGTRSAWDAAPDGARRALADRARRAGEGGESRPRTRPDTGRAAQPRRREVDGEAEAVAGAVDAKRRPLPHRDLHGRAKAADGASRTGPRRARGGGARARRLFGFRRGGEPPGYLPPAPTTGTTEGGGDGARGTVEAVQGGGFSRRPGRAFVSAGGASGASRVRAGARSRGPRPLPPWGKRRSHRAGSAEARAGSASLRAGNAAPRRGNARSDRLAKPKTPRARTRAAAGVLRRR